MKLGSLFSGIGGFDKAAREVGWETYWYSEVDDYACDVMRKNFPGTPNLGDIRDLRGSGWQRTDVLAGGFPCQDISGAGNGLGLSGTRSGLWYEFARCIEEINPAYVVIENVAILRRRGLGEILRALHALGYDAEWHCIPASYVGAHHRRDRLWIVANATRVGRKTTGLARARLDAEGDGPADLAPWGGHVPGNGPHPLRARLEGLRIADKLRRYQAEIQAGGICRWSAEPSMGRVAHGVPNWMDRIRCLGNALVPEIPRMIFRAIQEYEDSGT